MPGIKNIGIRILNKGKAQKNHYSLFTIHYSNKGFTLIEIITAMLIISVIFAAAFPNLRRFNQGQDLEAATSELIQVLKLAQSNAMSEISCGTFPANSWTAKITTTSYQLRADCIDRTGGTTQANLVLTAKPFSQSGAISMKLTPGNSNICYIQSRGNSIEIQFSKNTITFNCPDDATQPSVPSLNNFQPATIELTDGTNNSTVVAIYKSGVIKRL